MGRKVRRESANLPTLVFVNVYSVPIYITIPENKPCNALAFPSHPWMLDKYGQGTSDICIALLPIK